MCYAKQTLERWMMTVIEAAPSSETLSYILWIDSCIDGVWQASLSLTGDEALAEELTAQIFIDLWQGNKITAKMRPHRTAYLYQSLVQGCREIVARRDALPGDAVARLVNRLDEDQALCLCLYHYECMSIAEIAECLVLPAGMIAHHLQTARSLLHGMLPDMRAVV